MRIIAGRFKGRRLRTPTWEGLRPTSDRLRETLFNLLGARVPGARVLDGYAGTGAVGLEALSRGAAHVTFVEQDRRAVSLIVENATACGLGEERRDYTVERGNFVTAARRLAPRSFDLVLLDPPYEGGGVDVLEAAGQLVADGGLLVLERATRRPPELPGGLTHVRDVRSGDSTLTMLAATAGAIAPVDALRGRNP